MAIQGKYREMELVASRTETSNDNSGTVNTLPTEVTGSDLVVYLDVTASSGTSETMDITINGIVNNKVYQLGAFTQATGVTTERVVITDAPADVRFDWTLGGTSPSFTFNIQSHRS